MKEVKHVKLWPISRPIWTGSKKLTALFFLLFVIVAGGSRHFADGAEPASFPSESGQRTQMEPVLPVHVG
jgi:hypothetical protein